MNLPDSTTLRILLAAIEHGSVTRTWEKCGIAVSAAAKRIQHMEAELGVRLLDRTARGVTPTAAGDLVAQHARAMFDFGARLGKDLRADAEAGLASEPLGTSARTGTAVSGGGGCDGRQDRFHDRAGGSRT
jgi:DNA-binding transcriptional LysR family regulator